MKAMRLLMMAVMTVFMGTTFTSCLDSGDGGRYIDAIFGVTITEGIMGGISIKPDNGLTLNLSNPSALELQFTDGTTLVPRRGHIAVYLDEGEQISAEKTTYNVTLATDQLMRGYSYYSQAVNSVTDFKELETKTPVYGLSELYFGDNYLDVSFISYVFKEHSLSDLRLCFTGVENETIKMKLMNSVEIDPNDKDALSGSFGISYNVPGLQEIKNYYPELKTFGSTNDSVYVELENKTYEGKTLKKLPIKLR